MATIDVRVEKLPGEYESPFTKVVRAPRRPSAESRARLGIPGIENVFRTAKRASKILARYREENPPAAVRQSPVPLAK
jgi:hypothetical protein